MISTVSSPAMVPAVSGNLAASTAAARGCAPLGGVFKTSRFRGTNVLKELAESASEGRQAVGFFRERGRGAIAFVSFDEAKLLEITGQRGLRDAQFLRGEAAAQVFLIGDGSVGDEAQDLAVAKCFAGIHRAVKICTHLYIYTGSAKECQCQSRISRELSQRAGLEREDSDAGFAPSLRCVVDSRGQ